MKTNWIKYIFFAIVILLIGLAVYMLYKDTGKSKVNIKNDAAEIITESQINIGITNYDTINPILSKSKDVQYLSNLIYDSLIKISPDFKAENNIAEEWSKINETTYLIRLKQNIHWHNNTLLTTKDVKFTIDGIKTLTVDSIYKKNVEDISSVEIIDDYTIKIYLNREIPFFEYMLSFPILSAENYEVQTLESKTKTPIGTGYYEISDMQNGEIILEKRSLDLDFKVEKIFIKIYNSPMDLYNNLTRENIDLINTTNIEYEKYIGTIGFNSSICHDREFDYMAINNENKILANKEIRQALNYAIDKKAIVYNIYNNKYFTSKFPLDYGSYLYNNENTEDEYNTEKAKKVLSDNGWIYQNNTWKKTGVSNKLEFNLIVNGNDESRIIVAENIKEQLDKVGIKINIQKVSDFSFQNYIKNKNYELVLTGNTCSVCPDLNSYLGVDNLSNYYNEEIINLLKEINNIQNLETLKERYCKIIDIYNEEIPFISLYFNGNALICNSKIKGNMEHSWYDLFYNINTCFKIR